CGVDVLQQHPTTLSQPSSLSFNTLHHRDSRAVAYPSAIHLNMIISDYCCSIFSGERCSGVISSHSNLALGIDFACGAGQQRGGICEST
ncbi:MAG: hypothetical protein M0038_20325, partial [Pseudomonadota bacterium]|nr:hypothetical protein [Pseudomonadota bacterium]